ncbi:HIT family protein [Caulobacter sp. S45]|uniref:HIT family protein n=1 Tax=Caulobacter sp. S45 TaxID=1641861 RepID=UPI001576B60E|nr:HIT family protein [Caulobacter sp. S45]
MSLDGAYDPDNLFARILRGELPCAKVYEDADVFAFMDIFPQSRGHLLVIGKASRARNLLDVEPGDLAKLIAGVQRLARATRAALKPDGLAVSQFNGAPAGQTVFHLHFHVIPRYAHEPLRGHAQGTAADADELAVLARAIAAEID